LFWLLGDKQNDWTTSPSSVQSFAKNTVVSKFPRKMGPAVAYRQRRQRGAPFIFSLASGTRVFVAPVV
jgi:hypothetical protein